MLRQTKQHRRMRSKGSIERFGILRNLEELQTKDSSKDQMAATVIKYTLFSHLPLIVTNCKKIFGRHKKHTWVV